MSGLECFTPWMKHPTMENDRRNSKWFICSLIGTILLMSVSFAVHATEASQQATLQKDAAAGWSSLGAMPVPTWDGKTLLFHSEQGILAITPLSDNVIRVHFTTAKLFGRDHSYAVVNRDWGKSEAKVKDWFWTSSTVQTASLKVTVQQSPLRISFANSAGEILDADDSEHGISFASDGEFRVAKQLRDDEHVYGLGEKNGRLDKRGWQLGGYNYVMWNSDTYAYDSSTDPIYVSVPFYMVVRHGQAHGIFLDNTWRSFFDIGHEQQGVLTFGAARRRFGLLFHQRT